MKTNKNFNNKQVTHLLQAMAAALEVKGKNQFRIIAYDRAATAIAHATSEIKDLWDDNQLEKIPGVGKNIARHLDELFRTGRVKHFERTMQGLPPAMFELLTVPGVGPKTAFKLCQELKIKKAQNAVEKLKKAAQKGQIRQIEGFGKQSEVALLQNLGKQKSKQKERMLLPYASGLALKVIAFMQKEKSVLRADPLGSLRRQTATVGDLDIGVATEAPKKVIAHFCCFPPIDKVIAAGGNTARIKLKSGQQIDLKTEKPAAYGSLLQHYTGSKQHNIQLRELALKKKLSLSEHGVKSQGKIKPFAQEKSFYAHLGLKMIPPELREAQGEIEASQKNKLPTLVELKDIKGDLHVHSSFQIETSHDPGADSFQVMAQKAQSLGYQYLGLSEHNPSVSQHTEKQIISLIKRKKELIDKLNYSYKKNTQKNDFRLLNGLEVDIKTNGALALSEQAVDLLDYAVASVHASFGLPRQEMTKRVLVALGHPKVKILGHPTGRLLNRREGYELDWEKVFAFCFKHRKFLEINAFPERLDLPDVLVRAAVKKGVKMVINTDSHEVGQMDLMAFGVAVARRGWAEKKDIVNTLPLSKLDVILGIKK